jgi:hypothetical protein
MPFDTAPGQPGQPQQTAVLNALVPPEGPRVVAVACDFSQFQSFNIDFTLAMAQARITAVQTISLDNSANSDPVTIKVDGTAQSITAPARSQGVYAVISTNRPKFLVTSAGSVPLTLLFLNVPLPTDVWFSGGATGVGAAALATRIAAGGTAVAVFNPPPDGGGTIVNPFNASESLFVDIVNTAQTTAPGTQGTTVELVPGQAFSVPANFGGVVSANAITTGHTFSAYGIDL